MAKDLISRNELRTMLLNALLSDQNDKNIETRSDLNDEELAELEQKIPEAYKNKYKDFLKLYEKEKYSTLFKTENKDLLEFFLKIASDKNIQDDDVDDALKAKCVNFLTAIVVPDLENEKESYWPTLLEIIGGLALLAGVSAVVLGFMTSSVAIAMAGGVGVFIAIECIGAAWGSPTAKDKLASECEQVLLGKDQSYPKPIAYFLSKELLKHPKSSENINNLQDVLSRYVDQEQVAKITQHDMSNFIKKYTGKNHTMKGIVGNLVKNTKIFRNPHTITKA